jgi:NADH-quinone oxidoreductase subunit H
MFDFQIVTTWFDSLLRDTLGLGSLWSIIIECVIVGLIILTAYALLAIALIFMERKVCAYFQCRLGPMRVGPWGIFQVFADVVKMLIKEIFAVDKADKLLYAIAPFLVLIGSVGAFSFMPWNKNAGILDFNVGVFLITAISSIGVIGIFMAGWSSNNKFGVVSAMRGAVQMISYEMSLGLCLIAAVALTGTMSVSGIIDAQSGPFGWLIFKGHIPAIIAFVVFLIAGNAEANRGPFDLAEAESELTAGYHTEYSWYGLRILLSRRIPQYVHCGRYRRYGVPGWLDANPHRRGRFRPGDGLHPRIRLVPWQDIRPGVGAALDQVDLSPSAYRPDIEVGVEVSHAALIAQSCAHDHCRGMWMVH